MHDDGEIWAQTLWDLRTALGVEPAREVITEAMRLVAARAVVPRHAQRDPAGARRTTTGPSGRSSRARGMGYFASTDGSSDIAPIADASLPPPSATSWAP